MPEPTTLSLILAHGAPSILWHSGSPERETSTRDGTTLSNGILSMETSRASDLEHPKSVGKPTQRA
jgi:hypothetical protein